MWTVAPDGGVWFWKNLWLLERRDDAGAQIYQTPFKSSYSALPAIFLEGFL
jgi:hypothetical protein